MELSGWLTTLIGLVAGVCTTAALVPQAVRVWRLKRADEIALSTFLLIAFGTAIWVVYGFLISSVPVILANAVTLVLALSIVGLKLTYDRSERSSVGTALAPPERRIPSNSSENPKS